MPTVYLWMPLGRKHKDVEILDNIPEKAEKRLTLWKAQYLSLGGRVTLINSVLDSLPTYVMSLFPIPACVIKRLNKLRRDFLWKGNKEEGATIWSNGRWCSTDQGGLGIRNLRTQNNSLLMKWLCRFSAEESTLWKEVISNKFGQSSPWCSNEVNSTYRMVVWRAIRSLWPKLQCNFRMRIGNGSKTLFWKDIWIG